MPVKDSSAALLATVQSMLRRLVEASAAEGREAALASITDQLLGTRARRGRPAGRKGRRARAAAPVAKKSRKRRKNPWATLSPADRLARINAIRKGRGLPPRDKL